MLSVRTSKAEVFPGFNGLRCIAALSVALTHSGFLSGYSIRTAGDHTFQFNFPLLGRFSQSVPGIGSYLLRMDVGVAIFFVISGFLLYRPFVAERFEARRGPALLGYGRRRFLRIAPAYWLVLLAVLLIPGIQGLQEVPLTPGRIVAHFTLLHTYNPSFGLVPVQQAWTLVTEVAFYLMLPFYASLLRRLGGSAQRKFRHELIGVVAMFFTALAFRAWVLIIMDPSELRGFMNLWLPARLDHFAFGMLLAAASVRHSQQETEPRWTANRWLPLGSWAISAATFIALSVALADTDPVAQWRLSGIREWWLLLAWGVIGVTAVLPAVFGPQDRGIIRSALCFAPIAWLGTISYGIYLWHEAALDAYLRITNRPAFGADMFPTTLFMVGFSILISAISYYLVERPAMSLKNIPISRWFTSKGHDRGNVIDRLTPRTKHWILLSVLTVGFLLPLRGLLRSQGPPMEEGFMLVFPEQVLLGNLPNRDFLHLYGPGSLWWLAAIFKVFGTLLEVERLAALAQMVAIVSGVTIIARRWTTTLALLCGAISLVLIIPPIGLTALAWVGAVGLGILGVATATASVADHRSARNAARLAFVGGLLFGAALLFRLDLVLAVGLAAIALLRAFDKRRRRHLVGGILVGVSPYILHIATAGPYNVFRGMVLDPVVYLRGGRTLPLPPSFTTLAGFLQRAGDYGSVGKLDWPLPTLSAASQIAIWFWSLIASVGFIFYVALRRDKRTGGSLRSTSLVAIALFSVGLLPQALQRADSAHLAWVSCVPLALLPVAIRELIESRRGLSWTPRHLDMAAALPVLLFISLVIPRYILNTYADFTAQTFGRHRYSYLIERGDRRFYYGRVEVAEAAQDGVIPALDMATRRGDSLIVATADLRKTPYSDAYLYYLFPELKVGTYYIEMDPGVANAVDSKLPQEVAAADFLVLSSVWHDWDEPNDARDAIDNGANAVVRDNFVCVGEYGMLPPDAPAPMDFIYQLWMNEDLVASRGIPFEVLGETGRACSQGLMLAD